MPSIAVVGVNITLASGIKATLKRSTPRQAARSTRFFLQTAASIVAPTNAEQAKACCPDRTPFQRAHPEATRSARPPRSRPPAPRPAPGAPTTRAKPAAALVACSRTRTAGLSGPSAWARWRCSAAARAAGHRARPRQRRAIRPAAGPAGGGGGSPATCPRRQRAGLPRRRRRRSGRPGNRHPASCR